MCMQSRQCIAHRENILQYTAEAAYPARRLAGRLSIWRKFD